MRKEALFSTPAQHCLQIIRTEDTFLLFLQYHDGFLIQGCVFYTLLQFSEQITRLNYALNFMIFDITLAVSSSSILSQLYQSSPTVATCSGENASHHLCFCASLLYFLFAHLLHFFIFCFVCSDLSCPSPWLGIAFFFSCAFQPPQCFGSGTVTSIVLADTNLDLILSDH